MTEPTKITVSFKKSPDYKLYPATGAWGGPTTDGHILMHVIVEHASLPSYQTFARKEDGSVNTQEPVETVASGDGERVLLCGIMMSPQTAKSVAKWLENHADRLLGGKE